MMTMSSGKPVPSPLASMSVAIGMSVLRRTVHTPSPTWLLSRTICVVSTCRSCRFSCTISSCSESFGGVAVMRVSQDCSREGSTQASWASEPQRHNKLGFGFFSAGYDSIIVRFRLAVKTFMIWFLTLSRHQCGSNVLTRPSNLVWKSLPHTFLTSVSLPSITFLSRGQDKYATFTQQLTKCSEVSLHGLNFFFKCFCHLSCTIANYMQTFDKTVLKCVAFFHYLHFIVSKPCLTAGFLLCLQMWPFRTASYTTGNNLYEPVHLKHTLTFR